MAVVDPRLPQLTQQENTRHGHKTEETATISSSKSRANPPNRTAANRSPHRNGSKQSTPKAASENGTTHNPPTPKNVPYIIEKIIKSQ